MKNTAVDFNVDMHFVYPDTDSKYRQWLTKKYKQLEREAQPSNFIYEFVAKMGVVCAFNAEEMLHGKTISSNLTDLARFEAGCYVGAVVERCLRAKGLSSKDLEKEFYTGFLIPFAHLSAGVLSLEMEEIVKIICSRITNYQQIEISKRPYGDNIATLAEYMYESVKLGRPVPELKPYLNLSLDLMAWTTPFVGIWDTCYMPILYAFMGLNLK